VAVAGRSPGVRHPPAFAPAVLALEVVGFPKRLHPPPVEFPAACGEFPKRRQPLELDAVLGAIRPAALPCRFCELKKRPLVSAALRAGAVTGRSENRMPYDVGATGTAPLTRLACWSWLALKRIGVV